MQRLREREFPARREDGTPPLLSQGVQPGSCVTLLQFRRRRTAEHVEFATPEYADWFNQRRLHESLRRHSAGRERRQPVVRRAPNRGWVGPHVPVQPSADPARTGLGEPWVPVGGVVGHEVDQHPQPAGDLLPKRRGRQCERVKKPPKNTFQSKKRDEARLPGKVKYKIKVLCKDPLPAGTP